jgi:hypothetical protein
MNLHDHTIRPSGGNATCIEQTVGSHAGLEQAENVPRHYLQCRARETYRRRCASRACAESFQAATLITRNNIQVAWK